MSQVLELIRRCEKAGAEITVNGQKLRVDAPAALPGSIKEELRRHKSDIIQALKHRPQQTLHTRLNLMISAGASFEVSKDGFQVIGVENLTHAEKHFLSVNKPFVLCTIQQAILMKYLSSVFTG